MKQSIRQWWSDESGQALSEYGLIMALVGIALVVTIVAFRSALADKFTQFSNSLNS